MNENLILGFTVANSSNTVNVSNIYDQIEMIIPDAEIDRFDKRERSKFTAGAIDFTAILSVSASLVTLGTAIYSIYKTQILPHKEENKNIGLYVSVGPENKINFMLGDSHSNEKEFVEDFVLKVDEHLKTTQDGEIHKTKEINMKRTVRKS